MNYYLGYRSQTKRLQINRAKQTNKFNRATWIRFWLVMISTVLKRLTKRMISTVLRRPTEIINNFYETDWEIDTNRSQKTDRDQYKEFRWDRSREWYQQFSEDWLSEQYHIFRCSYGGPKPLVNDAIRASHWQNGLCKWHSLNICVSMYTCPERWVIWWWTTQWDNLAFKSERYDYVFLESPLNY